MAPLWHPLAGTCWFLPFSTVVRLPNCSRVSPLVSSASERPRCRSAALCTWCPRFFPSRVRVPCQLYADDAVIPAGAESDLQAALGAVSEWSKWRFTFGISPAVMICGPRTRVPSCAVTLAGSSLPIVRECTFLGVVLTSSVCLMVSLRLSPSPLCSLPFPVLRRSQHFMGIGVLPQLESRPSTDGWCSAQVGSSSPEVSFWFSKRCCLP